MQDDHMMGTYIIGYPGTLTAPCQGVPAQVCAPSELLLLGARISCEAANDGALEQWATILVKPRIRPHLLRESDPCLGQGVEQALEIGLHRVSRGDLVTFHPPVGYDGIRGRDRWRRGAHCLIQCQVSFLCAGLISPVANSSFEGPKLFWL